MAPHKRKPDGRLEGFRKKRSADRTPEPYAGGSLPRARMFVVQKHAATRMHYDLRLEMDGVLHSWAVPKGPSLDPEVKRLAVEVEEHPLDYGDFEGTIPAGEYGAGAVVLWDRGRWDPIGDPAEGLIKGKLLFDLHGYKLRGRWTLFRTKGKGGKQNEWLMMKKPDGEAGADKVLSETSIRSGMTVEEILAGVDPAEKIRHAMKTVRTGAGLPELSKLSPMLAHTREKPFSKKGWIFEIKYDGYRLLAAKQGDEVRLRYRRGSDVTGLFPELAWALRVLPYPSLAVDGEVVVLDDDGRPSFQGLQQRVHLSRRSDIAQATVDRPATFFLFDLLGFDDRDLRGTPLLERKRLLEMLLPGAGALRYCEHIPEEGEAMFEAVRELRLEGIVAKKAGSRYFEGRSNDWLKIRADRTDDFVVVGFSPPKGARDGFGALHLAIHDDGKLTYAGRVGTGFGAGLLEELHAELENQRLDVCPCEAGKLPKSGGHTWVQPLVVVEVRYKEWTGEGHLRHPVFLRLRDDKTAEECVRHGASSAPPEPSKRVARPARQKREVSLTNLQKIFWPDEGYTKGDLIEYYRDISPWLLPYLADRPLVLTRYPDGIDGKNFFQKDAPGYIPAWIRTETMWSEHARREVHYFIVDNVESLIYLANMATIPLHLWSSRVADLQHPDWSILDLDPKDAPFEQVIVLARAIKKLCDSLELPCYCKTSGSSGLHVLIPLAGMCTYEQSRTLAQLLARVIAGEHREIATLIRSPSARGGRVYVDYLQNGHGRLLVAPFCVRPLPGAPVSAPLKWTEVKRGLDLGNYTIKTMPRRMKRLGFDPLRPVLDARPDLTDALARLAERLDAG